MKSLLFILFALLARTNSLASDFKVVAEITIETEPGIKRYEAHTDIGGFFLSDTKPIVKHSAKTKPGKTTIQFLVYENGAKTAYAKLLDDLGKNSYRPATVQELCSVQSGVPGVTQKQLYCYGTQVYVEGLPGLQYSGIYQVNVTNTSNVSLLQASDAAFKAGTIIAAIKIAK